MYRSFIFALCAVTLTVAPAAVAQDDDDGGMKLAPSLERVAGFSYASVKPQNETSVKGTFVGLGGPVHNPLSMPRAAFDVYLPSGLGLGAALGFSSVSPTQTSQSGRESTQGTFTAYVISPRIGYRLPVSPFFDIVPRFGVTFMGGSIQDGERNSCTFNGTTTTCNSVPGTKESATAIALSPEVMGVIRLTHTFNITGGLSYDHIVSASGTETRYSGDGTNRAETADGKGTFSSIHLWFGMGGYL